MSRQRQERASKTKAVEEIVAMIAQPLPTSCESGAERVWLRFSRSVWNGYQPWTHEAKISSLKSKAVHKRRRKPGVIKTGDGASTKGSPPQPRQCKVKVTRFQYGGPDARVAGKSRNDITIDAPCLQPTCANCSKWHAHLMRGPLVTGTNLNNKHVSRAPETWPLSPVIDPKISDDAWQMHDGQRNGMNDLLCSNTPSAHGQGSTTSVPMLANRVIKAQRAANLSTAYASTTTLTPPRYNIVLLQHRVPHVSSKMFWCKSPRQRCTTRLSFSTPCGRAKFRALVHEHARKEIKREHKRLGQAMRGDVIEMLMRGTDGTRRRSRHRVRLVFRSGPGKEKYRRLVKSDLW